MKSKSKKLRKGKSELLRLWQQRLKKKLFGALPKSLRHQIMRQHIQFSVVPPTNVIFKIAESQSELEQAFTLLHDNYVASGFMDPHPSKMRLTKYHTLPSTSTLIAVRDGQVIATVSLIRSSAFGLPCEMAYDIHFLRKKMSRIAEISALAVRPDCAGIKGEILCPLLKFLRQYATDYFAADYLVMVVSPAWFDFYEAIWFFQPFQEQKINYSYVKGTPAKGGYLNLRSLYTLAEMNYPNKQNLIGYFAYNFELSLECFQFPDRKTRTVNDPILTPDLLDYFFNRKSSVLSELSNSEKIILHQLYNSSSFSKVLPPVASISHEKSRRVSEEKRFDVDCNAQLLMRPTTQIAMRVKSISKHGLGALMPRKIRYNQEYTLWIECGWGKAFQLVVTPVWHFEDGSCGFVIAQCPQEWIKFIDDLDNLLLRIPQTG